MKDRIQSIIEQESDKVNTFSPYDNNRTCERAKQNTEIATAASESIYNLLIEEQGKLLLFIQQGKWYFDGIMWWSLSYQSATRLYPSQLLELFHASK